MKRVSDERLDELIAERFHVDPERAGEKLAAVINDVTDALRELRDYRKAVREYTKAIDAMRDANERWVRSGTDEYDAIWNTYRAAEATLRALQSGRENHRCQHCGNYTCEHHQNEWQRP